MVYYLSMVSALLSLQSCVFPMGQCTKFRLWTVDWTTYRLESRPNNKLINGLATILFSSDQVICIHCKRGFAILTRIATADIVLELEYNLL